MAHLVNCSFFCHFCHRKLPRFLPISIRAILLYHVSRHFSHVWKKNIRYEKNMKILVGIYICTGQEGLVCSNSLTASAYLVLSPARLSFRSTNAFFRADWNNKLFKFQFPSIIISINVRSMKDNTENNCRIVFVNCC